MIEFLKRLLGINSTATSPVRSSHNPSTAASTNKTPSTQKLTFAEKELLAVKRTTQEDVYRLSGFPYLWNRPIEKYIEPNAHPFVYMDIVGENLAIAKSEIEKMNAYIKRDKKLIPYPQKNPALPIDKMLFKRTSESGYSRIMLSPVTYNGKPSKYPVSLFFMSDPWNSNYSGTIFYGQDGTIQKADIFIGNGSYFLYYEIYEGDFVLVRVEDCCRNNVYKGKPLLDHEERLIKTEKDYAWLQENLPDKCPSSLTSYRTMRTRNTSNFQILKSLAADLGREI